MAKPLTLTLAPDADQHPEQCRVEGCTKTSLMARGLCSAHYAAAKDRGTTVFEALAAPAKSSTGGGRRSPVAKPKSAKLPAAPKQAPKPPEPVSLPCNLGTLDRIAAERDHATKALTDLRESMADALGIDVDGDDAWLVDQVKGRVAEIKAAKEVEAALREDLSVVVDQRDEARADLAKADEEIQTADQDLGVLRAECAYIAHALSLDVVKGIPPDFGGRVVAAMQVTRPTANSDTTTEALDELLDDLVATAAKLPLGVPFVGGPLDGTAQYNVFAWAIRKMVEWRHHWMRPVGQTCSDCREITACVLQDGGPVCLDCELKRVFTRANKPHVPATQARIARLEGDMLRAECIVIADALSLGMESIRAGFSARVVAAMRSARAVSDALESDTTADDLLAEVREERDALRAQLDRTEIERLNALVEADAAKRLHAEVAQQLRAAIDDEDERMVEWSTAVAERRAITSALGLVDASPGEIISEIHRLQARRA